jgi:peptide/nickel transport system substrate-binding protein
MQNGEPISLYCNDEVDGESFRVCHQIHESLLDFAIGGGDIIPGLAESWESNEDATVWTFRLRENVLFHDGSTLHANDVITSWAAMWDTQHPLHIGNTGVFQFWNTFFQGFLNPTD